MISLWSLFSPRTRLQCFALLNAQGCCRALRESREKPGEPGWVEVHELRNSWLGQPLPKQAMVTPNLRTANTRPALAT